MIIQPVILEYPDGPNLGISHQIAAGYLTRDVARVFTKITKRSPQFNPSVLKWDMPRNMDPGIKNMGVRASSPAWWDVWAEARRRGVDLDDTVLLVWHGNLVGDFSGIAQPNQPHLWNEEADPTAGGIATNGLGQLQRSIDSNFLGPRYRVVVYYAAHELGHALGRHHIWNPNTNQPDPHFEPWTSIMGYKYASFAYGRKIGEHYPSPLLARPEEIVTWRAHTVFEDIPERWNTKEAGWADDLVLMKKQEALALLEEIDDSELRARIIAGTLTREQAMGL